MKVQTQDLTDLALDWAVAKIRGYIEIKIFTPHRPTDRGWIDVRMNPDRRAPLCRYDPTLDWHYGGPIIERENITLIRANDAYETGADGFTTNKSIPQWFAETDSFVGHSIMTSYEGEYMEPTFMIGEGGGCYGPTPLIAAMRCYVASKLGDEVEVPDELLRSKT